jgi:hypothetical protein
MSVGGVFQLISNNGIQDKLIMATDELMKNVRKIGCEKLSNLRYQFPNKSDKEIFSMDEAWMPTLNAIEKTHILFINSSFKPFVAMAHEYSRTPPRQGKAQLGGTFSFTLPIIGEFVNDMVMYVKLTGLSALSNFSRVRYYELLGHRLCKKVKFKIQNHVFDEYNSSDQNAHYQFKVPVNKEIGYLRNIGHEIPRIGSITADPRIDNHRQYVNISDGPQTYQQVQPDVEMWIPMLFWFKNIQNSLPNFILPMNQTDIEITFEDESNLISLSNNTLGTDPIDDQNVATQYTVPIVSECYLYINHIFLLPEINKIFITRFGFQLIRVHRNHTQQLTNPSDSIRLHQLKWPVECLYICFRPRINDTNSVRWHRCAHLVQDLYKMPVIVDGVMASNSAVVLKEHHVIKTMSLLAHDVIIYPDLPPGFYNHYIPSQYGEHIKTPRDIGWYMMNFNVNPGNQQPSGHLNVSKTRELYLKYVSALDPATGNDIISAANPVDLLVIADCINFLLFKDGSAVLRFST